MLAHVVVSKYADHLPLHRQAVILGRQGLEVNRSTLCGWTAQVAELLEPLHEAMKVEVLKSKVIHGDDTPVAVLDRREDPPPGVGQKRKKARQGRLWVWVGDKGHPHTVFDYTPNRRREGPLDFLGGWRGYLQADAYPGYNTLYRERGVVEVACWAHTRRKFFDALDVDRERGQAALAFIHRLYQVEAQARDMEPRQRQKLRQKEALPVLLAFKEWLDGQALLVLPRSAMGEAMGYALRQWPALCRYVEDGDLAIDNNAAENALRGVALGRKNWLFEGSDEGGKRAAVLYSLIQSCRRHKVEPYAYLKDVISRISGHPARKLKELMPAYWTAGGEGA
jgi:transposase